MTKEGSKKSMHGVSDKKEGAPFITRVTLNNERETI